MLHKTKVKCHRGDIFFCEFPDVGGSVQNGCRPALVIQNDIGNKNSSTTIVSPITSVIKRKDLPTHIILEKQCGLEERSMVMLEQIITVDKDVHLKEYVGTITDSDLIEKINKAIRVSIIGFPVNRIYFEEPANECKTAFFNRILKKTQKTIIASE